MRKISTAHNINNSPTEPTLRRILIKIYKVRNSGLKWHECICLPYLDISIATINNVFRDPKQCSAKTFHQAQRQGESTKTMTVVAPKHERPSASDATKRPTGEGNPSMQETQHKKSLPRIRRKILSYIAISVRIS